MYFCIYVYICLYCKALRAKAGEGLYKKPQINKKIISRLKAPNNYKLSFK